MITEIGNTGWQDVVTEVAFLIFLGWFVWIIFRR